ncbi:Alpha/Beta hydrolase protein [Aspergillus pseudoustus]|uniref:Alpha/Beta hydrolase protein n=1 Tax=Aspergillus pseudoustus TaxID=1810923 RepID=A0ABR4JUJ2_9EURO
MRAITILTLIISIASRSLSHPTSSDHCNNLPIVDLGYNLHQAISYNASSEIYKFQNIRYANNPTLDLRFRAPTAPDTNRSAVQTGERPRTCPQGIPEWQVKGTAASTKYMNPDQPFTLEAWEQDFLNATLPPNRDFNRDTTEDCLFLDVHVPRKVFHRARKGASGGAPVLVFIHGGGYVLSSKLRAPTPAFFPDGLFAHASENHEEMIYVGINYRLGALGFLADPEVERDGVLNAGLLDQRFALEWVQRYIHLFGGSRDKVTAMGESAGGGSILLHMAGSYATNTSTPFRAAIPQSPAILPGFVNPRDSYGDFLRYLNVSSLREAREVDESRIIAANAAQIADAPTTSYIYEPVIDGTYVPDKVMHALRDGRFDRSVAVLAAQNSFEGSFFFDPTIETEHEFREWLRRSITGLQDKDIEYLMETLYPATFGDSALGYVDQSSRQMALWSEAVIDCHFDAIGDAMHGQSYACMFEISFSSTPLTLLVYDLTDASVV